MSEPDQNADYYSILGAAQNATQSEIERQYRRKAVRHHPDLGGDEEEMKRLNEAYGVLKDHAQRRSYDSVRENVIHTRSESEVEDEAVSISPPVQVDAITHQVLTASIFILLGLVLLFVVRFQYVIFLWPLALLAVFMIWVGIVQAHHVFSLIRRQIMLARAPALGVLVQEIVFWFFVIGGGYGVFLLLTAE